jgi:hypothetical protein
MEGSWGNSCDLHWRNFIVFMTITGKHISSYIVYTLHAHSAPIVQNNPSFVHPHTTHTWHILPPWHTTRTNYVPLNTPSALHTPDGQHTYLPPSRTHTHLHGASFRVAASAFSAAMLCCEAPISHYWLNPLGAHSPPNASCVGCVFHMKSGGNTQHTILYCIAHCTYWSSRCIIHIGR